MVGVAQPGVYGYQSSQQHAGNFLVSLAGQIQQGVIPSLNDLVSAFPPVAPQSPESQQLLARTIQVLSQAGPLGQERAKQFSLMMAQRDLQSTTGSLFTISGNLDPLSPESAQLQARLGAIHNIHGQLNAHLMQSLNIDPSRGGAINLNQGGFGGGYNFGAPGGNPVQALFSQMLQVMSMMLNSFTGR